MRHITSLFGCDVVVMLALVVLCPAPAIASSTYEFLPRSMLSRYLNDPIPAIVCIRSENDLRTANAAASRFHFDADEWQKLPIALPADCTNVSVEGRDDTVARLLSAITPSDQVKRVWASVTVGNCDRTLVALKAMGGLCEVYLTSDSGKCEGEVFAPMDRLSRVELCMLVIDRSLVDDLAACRALKWLTIVTISGKYVPGLSGLLKKRKFRGLDLMGAAFPNDQFDLIGRQNELEFLALPGAVGVSTWLSGALSFRDSLQCLAVHSTALDCALLSRFPSLRMYEQSEGKLTVSAAPDYCLEALQWVSLRDVEVSKALFDILSSAPKLEYLGLGSCTGSEGAWQGIASLQNVQALHIAACPGAVTCLATGTFQLSALRHLSLVGHRPLDDQTLVVIAAMKELVTLLVQASEGVSESAMQDLGKLVALRKLTIMGGAALTDGVLRSWSRQFQCLEDICISGNHFTTDGIIAITGMKSVRRVAVVCGSRVDRGRAAKAFQAAGIDLRWSWYD